MTRTLDPNKIEMPRGIHGFTRGKRYSLRPLCEDCFEEVTELQSRLQVPPPFEPGYFDCHRIIDVTQHNASTIYYVEWYR